MTSGGFTLTVMSVTMWVFPPPSSRNTGAFSFLPYRSHSAISTAALALVLCTSAFCTFRVTPSKSSISWPSTAGAMWCSMAPQMASAVSPVITPVGGASPKPTSPVSAVSFTIMSSTLATVRSAVLKGVLRGMDTRPHSTDTIFIRFPPCPE